jgi:hypothetical protein
MKTRLLYIYAWLVVVYGFYNYLNKDPDPISQYKSLAKDYLKLEDATSVNDKKLKGEKLAALNRYANSLVGSSLSIKCKVTDIVAYGYAPTGDLSSDIKDLWSEFTKDWGDIREEVRDSNKGLSEAEQRENSKNWKIKCIQGGKIKIDITLLMHVNFIEDDELNILEGLSEGDTLSFSGPVSRALNKPNTSLSLTFIQKLWIGHGIESFKQIYIY